MANKVLFITNEQVSHAFDTFYQGVADLIGHENVFDFPCAVKYHTDHRVPGHPYAWWCFYHNPHILSLDVQGWANEINSGNVKYIVATNRDPGPENLMKLISLINPDRFKDICITFIEEEHDLDFSIHRLNRNRLDSIWDKIDIFYKMDFVRHQVVDQSKVYPFYMSGSVSKLTHEVGEIKKFSERKYDVVYMAGNSHPNRKMYYDILQGLTKGNNLILWGQHRYSLREYFNLINDAKIFISVRGNEWSNTRNIEGPILGAALFTERLDIEIPNDYVDGKSAIFFDKTNLVPKLEEYVSSPKKLSALAKASNKHALENHTTTARAKQFFDLAKKVKGW